jgi:hypothetical protein
MDTFNMPLGGVCHEAFVRRVMAPPLESELEIISESPMRRSWKDSVM